jgi:hypothetical protein
LKNKTGREIKAALPAHAGKRQVMPQADKAMLVWWRRTSFTIFSISVMIGGIGFGLYL